MKKIAALLLSFILIISASACSKKQSQEKVSSENSQVNQNINQAQNTNQKPIEGSIKDRKSTLEQTEKVNAAITDLSNDIEKTLDSLDDIDESKLGF